MAEHKWITCPVKSQKPRVHTKVCEKWSSEIDERFRVSKEKERPHHECFGCDAWINELERSEKLNKDRPKLKL